MKIKMGLAILALQISAYAAPAVEQSEQLELSFHQAEGEAFKSSNRLKASSSDYEAAVEQADAGYAGFFPKLSLQGNYQYLGTVPSLSLGAGPAVQLTTHSSYSIGPVLSYTFWDSFASRKSRDSLAKVAEARRQDRRSTELQLLLAVRATYIRVQLALEELRLVNGSLELARAQDHDIGSRFHAGAATKLDVVTSNRQVLSFELQFKQKQADLSAGLKDLLALLGTAAPKDVSHPGPPNVDQVSLILKLDSLPATLAALGSDQALPPDDGQPQLRSQALLAESAALSASSQTAHLFPTLQASASTALAYPNGPIPQQIHQNIVSVSLSMPLYLGDPTWHLAAEKRKEADAARYREEQLRIDIQRDFAKAREMLDSLREQRKLATQDVSQSKEAAKLYYSSYKAGKNNLIDVQTANNQALQSLVGAARIDAQILTQLITLKALSGKDIAP